MDTGMLLLDGQPISPVGTPIGAIRARLEPLPLFSRYADQVDAVLVLLDEIRPWLPSDTGPMLANAAFNHNDAICQLVDGYSARYLASQVRQFSKVDAANDTQAIMAFALGCSLRALESLSTALRGDSTGEISALELFCVHLDPIDAWVPTAAEASGVSEAAQLACEMIGERAEDALSRAAAKVDGIRGGITRRGDEGSGPRDRAIKIKALELLIGGTEPWNLVSKLRDWQRRETGSALSKPAMGAVLDRLGPIFSRRRKSTK
ncbi:hypothetical protein D3C78_408880 [compost metagenome]